MTLDDLHAVWQTADDPAPPVQPEALSALRSEADRFDRAIRWRDRREYAAAAVVAVAFGLQFPHAPSAVRVGIVLAVLGAAFVCFWMWRAQRRRPPVHPAAPAADALRVALARVEIQIRLLRTVAWWYLAPLMVGPLLMVGAGYVEAARHLPPIETTRHMIGAAVGFGGSVLILSAVGAFLWWIWRINQRAVDRDLIPLRDRLSDTLHALTDDA